MGSPDELVHVTLEELLGEGRFGRVHAATIGVGEDARRVAVKVLRREHASDEDAIDRLIHEGRILGSLAHPGIVSFEGRVSAHGRPGVVMELVDGCSLEEWLAETGSLSQRAAVELVQQVANALDAAWTQVGTDGTPLRLAHRDIKPGNVLVTTQGEVRLVDFGLARSDALQREQRTEATGRVGTVAYWAPECVTGRIDSPHAIDIYALGVTWLVARSGVGPWKARNLREHVELATTESAHREAVADAIAAADLSAPGRGLIEQMLAFEAHLRPTALQVGERCAAIAMVARGQPLAERAQHHPPRRSALLAATPSSLVGRVITVQERPQDRQDVPNPPDRRLLPVPPPPHIRAGATPPPLPAARTATPPPAPRPTVAAPSVADPAPRRRGGLVRGLRRLGLGCVGLALTTVVAGGLAIGAGGALVSAWWAAPTAPSRVDSSPTTARTPANGAPLESHVSPSPEPAAAPAPVDCPPLHSAGLRAAAQQGSLAAPVLACASSALADGSRPLDERSSAFDLLWSQAQVGCVQGGGCADWAALGARFPGGALPADRAEILALGLHTHGGPGAAQAAARYAQVALEEGAFVGRAGRRRKAQLTEILARSPDGPERP